MSVYLSQATRPTAAPSARGYEQRVQEQHAALHRQPTHTHVDHELEDQLRKIAELPKDRLVEKLREIANETINIQKELNQCQNRLQSKNTQIFTTQPQNMEQLVHQPHEQARQAAKRPTVPSVQYPAAEQPERARDKEGSFSNTEEEGEVDDAVEREPTDAERAAAEQAAAEQAAAKKKESINNIKTYLKTFTTPTFVEHLKKLKKEKFDISKFPDITSNGTGKNFTEKALTAMTTDIKYNKYDNNVEKYRQYLMDTLEKEDLEFITEFEKVTKPDFGP